MEAILNPALLLFLSGILIGTLFKLILHNSISKYLGYYLLLSLGLKGGASLQENGFINEVISALTLGVVFALLIPIIAYLYLKNLLNSDDAAALSGTYGSVSAVTFVTAIAYLTSTNQNFDNYMSAVLVVMEFPAISPNLPEKNKSKKDIMETYTPFGHSDYQTCLLYTSDAADE